MLAFKLVIEVAFIVLFGVFLMRVIIKRYPNATLTARLFRKSIQKEQEKWQKAMQKAEENTNHLMMQAGFIPPKTPQISEQT